MSVNKYNASTGELTNLASGQRTWVGTQAAYKAAKQAGTLPNNAIIAITDDEKDHNHYSTDEVETGMYWIDSKPIYRKVINCGILPDNGTTNTPHGITDLGQVINLTGISTDPTSSDILPLPYTWPSGIITMFISGGAQSVCIQTNVSGLSRYTSTYVIIEYTKSTD